MTLSELKLKNFKETDFSETRRGLSERRSLTKVSRAIVVKLENVKSADALQANIPKRPL